MNLIKSGAVCVFIFALFGCGNGDSKNGPGSRGQVNPNRINWDSVPSQFNPSITDSAFRTDGVSRIDLSLFEFERDGAVIYSDAIGASSGLLKIYRVYKDSASWGRLDISVEGDSLKLANYGQYQCSMRVENGTITGLKGGCYARVELYLPTGSQIEVYNGSKILTRRFIPMSAVQLIKAVDDANRDEEKFAAVHAYFQSYSGLALRPTLRAEEAGKVIHEFSFRDEKFEALRLVQGIISDRENIAKMIENEFSYFDRDEARKIAGI